MCIRDRYRIIKSHFLARKFNLDFVWNNFPGDKLVLIYREPQKSFAWWSEVMDLAPDHYPDYRPGYKDYNTLRELLWKESAKITDFAIRKGLDFKQYNLDLFKTWESFDFEKSLTYIQLNSSKHSDVYIALATIPER